MGVKREEKKTMKRETEKQKQKNARGGEEVKVSVVDVKSDVRMPVAKRRRARREVENKQQEDGQTVCRGSGGGAATSSPFVDDFGVAAIPLRSPHTTNTVQFSSLLLSRSTPTTSLPPLDSFPLGKQRTKEARFSRDWGGVGRGEKSRHALKHINPCTFAK